MTYVAEHFSPTTFSSVHRTSVNFLDPFTANYSHRHATRSLSMGARERALIYLFFFSDHRTDRFSASTKTGKIWERGVKNVPTWGFGGAWLPTVAASTTSGAFVAGPSPWGTVLGEAVAAAPSLPDVA